MHLAHLVIRNLRALTDIDFPLSSRVNVIVGPNAVGKTTILQAVRLAKAILAPRTQNETQQVLISLGAASPHFPQRLFLNSLAREITQPVEIRCTYALLDEEIAILRSSMPSLVQSVVASRIGQAFANPAILLQFMQSSEGQTAITATTIEVSGVLSRLESDKSLVLGVSMNGATGQIIASDPLAGAMIAFLDQRLPPSISLFSFFPADRALPMGEVNLQLGGPDMQQQMEAHNSQPQLKYLRLKNLIINSLVVTGTERDDLQGEFETIFSGLLAGRKIKLINVNELGLLSVITEEISTGRLIELDSLSSGEKNIALTFLIVARSIAKGGVALFDEPELHLNPAVAKDVLPFIINQYAIPKDIQFIMCTHSPEILSGAFGNEDCALLHLKSASVISRVGRRALDEYADALQRLGTSVSESLLYEGTVLVEGDDDVAFLEGGFPEIFRKYKVKDRGGRREIEKTIADLQAMEGRGEKVAPIFLIFDRDEEPTGLKSSAAVRVMQWTRRCVENYMIDLDVIADLLKDSSVTRRPISSEGEAHKLTRELAQKQLLLVAARDTFNSYGYLNPCLTKEDLQMGDLESLGSAFYDRISTARASIPDSPKDAWIAQFEKNVNERKQALHLVWDSKWRDLCDGKKLISDLHKAADLRMSESAFKARITQRMRDTSSDLWRVVKGILEDFMKRPAG